ncbi:MAG TPA: hypothetical protein VF466_00090, partial [Candidatus Saccharimonadales bacterium]
APPAPAPVAPAPTPIAPPAPVTPAPAPAPEPPKPAGLAPAPEAQTVAAEDGVTAAAPQDTSDEKASVQAQIDQFANAPAPVTPAPAPEAPSASDAIMADAVKDLVSGSPAPAPDATPGTSVTPSVAPAAPATPPMPTPIAPPAPVTPAPVAPPAPAPAPADDSVTISKKKIIKPLSPDDASAPAPTNLHDLLAKEGMNLDDNTQPPTPAPGAAAPGMPTMPHQPGHVISPTPTNAQGQPIDPNSISL